MSRAHAGLEARQKFAPRAGNAKNAVAKKGAETGENKKARQLGCCDLCGVATLDSQSAELRTLKKGH